MDESPRAMVNKLPRIQAPRSGYAFEAALHVTPSSVDQPQAPPAKRLWDAIDCSPGWTLVALIALYLAIACGQAATKLLWCDELITLAVARQGNFAAIWRALAAGADPNPPLTHWLVLLSTSAFGRGALAVRLPAVLCVLLAIVSLWVILRRWVAPGYAAVGVLAFMTTRGFDYAYDARSYAPLMGFSMASLALWLAAGERRGPARIAALGGMAAALALGLSSNYFGVLAFFPIALGEIVRATRSRRIGLGPWIAMALAALPLLAFRPLIRHNLAEFGPHAWNQPRVGMIGETYIVLVEGIFWPVLGLAICALWQRRRSGELPGSLRSRPTPQPHETTALAVLLLYPFLGFLIALGGHGLISPRCVVPVCCVFGIAAALLARQVFGASPRAGVILLGCALVWVTAREFACAFVLAQQRHAFFNLRDQIAAEPASQPIVVADSLLVLPLAHYSSAAVRARMVFPIDFDAIHRFEPDDSGEQNLWAGRDGLYPIRVVPFGLAAREPALTVVARPNGWLAQSLAVDGYRFTPALPEPAWQDLGGVFTPLAHEETRILNVRR